MAWNIHAYMTPHAWLWNLTNDEIIRSILQLTEGLVLKIEIPGLSSTCQSECFIMHVHNHGIRFCHLVIKLLISWTGTEQVHTLWGLPENMPGKDGHASSQVSFICCFRHRRWLEVSSTEPSSCCSSIRTHESLWDKAVTLFPLCCGLAIQRWNVIISNPIRGKYKQHLLALGPVRKTLATTLRNSQMASRNEGEWK